MSEQNILLIGFSGVGKTTAGTKLARNLGWSFVDIDAEVVQTQGGKFLHEIRDELGLDGHRRLEGRILDQLVRAKRQIVALGAGTVLDDRNWDIASGSGIVIWLDAKPETIYERLSKKYPDGVWIAQGDDPVREIETKKMARHEKYSRAHFTVTTDSKSPGDVAEEIMSILTQDGSA